MPIFISHSLFTHFIASIQVSNWDARPLSASQIHYASLDAHSMLAILDRIAGDWQCPACWTGAGEGYSMPASSPAPPAGLKTAGLKTAGLKTDSNTPDASKSMMGPGEVRSCDWRAFLNQNY